MKKESKIRPMTYIRTFSGVQFIVEIKRGEDTSYAMIYPPFYEIKDETNEGLPASAISKHDFTTYEGESYTFEEYQEKLRLLAEKLSKQGTEEVYNECYEYYEHSSLDMKKVRTASSWGSHEDIT